MNAPGGGGGMSLAVVRCPACRGESRVTLDSLGQMVGCPRCQSPFVAEEDIPVVQPSARPAVRPSVTRAATSARSSAVPVAPPRRRRPEPRTEVRAPVETDSPAEAAPEIPDPEHDPHLPPVAGLPVSVLVGLALLPFGIPLLWRVAPLLTGREATLSLAVPIALAVAAAALCLGVVYTIDWTATTRIKGVLMLVGLAYLSAAGLFFLKKDMMDRVRGWGGDPNQWNLVSLNGGACKVQMPGQVRAEENQTLAGLIMAEARRARHTPDDTDAPRYEYCVAVSKPDAAVKKPDAAWFARVGDKLKDEGGKPIEETEVNHQGVPGRQWTFAVGDGGLVRIVRVFVINGRVYYLSAEGPNLKTDNDEFGRPFFDSFFVKIN